MKPKRPTWHACEGEVSHYYLHEEGVSAQSYEVGIQQRTDPKPPRFPPGADYWIMMTVIERLRVADEFMPFVPDQWERRRGASHVAPLQVFRESGTPSCSMVLRTAYGVKSCRYNDQAPNGERFLQQAQDAYRDAASVVPKRQRPSAMDRLMERFERAFRRGAEA